MYTFYNEFFDKSGSSKDFEILKKSSTIIFGSLILLINISIFCYYEMKLNSKTLIKVENHGVSADFKKSGEYIIKSGSWASKKYFYGKYSIKDSIITVDRDYFNDVLVTNTFLIRRIENAFNKNDPNKIKNYLVELDKRGKEINNGYLFEIVKDNRK